MVYLKNIILATSLLLLTACGARTSIGDLSSSLPDGVVGGQIKGIITNTEGVDLDLEQTPEDKVLVLIFAQDTCTTCAAEADEISAKINELGALPSNVEVVTFMVGLTGEFAQEDAQDWKKIRKAQWTVGVQKDEQNLFRKYFGSSSTVPSILIQKNKQVIFRHVGALGIEKLEEMTGVWE